MTDITTLNDLTPDPENARKHSQDNIDMIMLSLQELGAARSIVIDENGVVLAGNATVAAAMAVGIGRVRVIDVDGETVVAVRRSGLTEDQKTRLALFDNRTTELSDWDVDRIKSFIDDGTDFRGLWSAEELAALVTFDPIPVSDATLDLAKSTVHCPNCGLEFPKPPRNEE